MLLPDYCDLSDVSGYELEMAGGLKGGRKLWALARTGQSAALKVTTRLMATCCWPLPAMARWRPPPPRPPYRVVCSQQDRHLFQRRYAYDANGNLAGIDDSRNGKRSYHYDPLDRLINVRGSTPESFAHDPAGNLLGQGDQPTANLANVKGNRLLMQGDRHYDYDAYGNLTRERRGTGQKLVTEYCYDCQHRLIRVSLPSGSNASYQYDAFGRRIAKRR